jgi:hypothetical protein
MTRVRELAGTLNRFLDYPRPPEGFPCPEPVWFGAIYRARNTATVEKLLTPVAGQHWDIHLWALDAISPPLERHTSGEGPGGKFDLLQRLLDRFPPTPSSWLVLSDDDYLVRRGTLAQLVALTKAAGLDLAQPAHRHFVNVSHHITLVRPRVVARRTHFVEIGPVIVMSPLGQTKLLPFPTARMGWGLEMLWSRSSLDGEINLGVIDGITIEHLQPPGIHYDIDAARTEQEHFLQQAGIRSYADVQTNVAWWRRLRRSPDWTIR